MEISINNQFSSASVPPKRPERIIMHSGYLRNNLGAVPNPKSFGTKVDGGKPGMGLPFKRLNYDIAVFFYSDTKKGQFQRGTENFRNPSNFDDLYLRAQEELGLRTGTIVEACPWTLQRT